MSLYEADGCFYMNARAAKNSLRSPAPSLFSTRMISGIVIVGAEVGLHVLSESHPGYLGGQLILIAAYRFEQGPLKSVV